MQVHGRIRKELAVPQLLYDVHTHARFSLYLVRYTILPLACNVHSALGAHISPVPDGASKDSRPITLCRFALAFETMPLPF